MSPIPSPSTSPVAIDETLTPRVAPARIRPDAVERPLVPGEGRGNRYAALEEEQADP
jgi:hypothetical protein